MADLVDGDSRRLTQMAHRPLDGVANHPEPVSQAEQCLPASKRLCFRAGSDVHREFAPSLCNRDPACAELAGLKGEVDHAAAVRIL